MTQSQDPFQIAKEIALRRLDRRECSAADIRRNLIQKGTDPEVAQTVVEELQRNSLIDDARFSRMLIRQQASRGKGPRVIQQKLREKGIQLDLNEIQSVVSEVTQTTEQETAKTLIEKKYPHAWEDRKEAGKAFQALLRRGFSYDLAREVLQKKN